MCSHFVAVSMYRTKTADTRTIQQSISCHHELDAKLKRVYISRTKEGELGDELPEKDETVRALLCFIGFLAGGISLIFVF